MSTIICDVDGVCADLHEEWLRIYRYKTSTDITPNDIHDWGFSNLNVDHDILASILRREDLYEGVGMIPDADLGVKCLRLMGHRVVFATSSNDCTAGQKMRWLQAHGFLPEGHRDHQFKDVVIIHDKSLLRGDIIIDDYVGNFTGFGGVKILFDQPHNRSLVADGFVRCYTWSDVVNYILRLV